MGSPELPNDPGEENLNTTNIVHHPIAASDDSDNESMADGAAYEGYQPLPIDENGTEYSTAAVNIDHEEFNTAHSDGMLYESADIVTHGDPNMPRIESVDTEVEREIWSQPRPQELEIELDTQKTQQILSAMANFTLPNMSVPAWADGVPEESWKEELLQRIRQRKPVSSNESAKSQTSKQ